MRSAPHARPDGAFGRADTPSLSHGVDRLHTALVRTDDDGRQAPAISFLHSGNPHARVAVTSISIKPFEAPITEDDEFLRRVMRARARLR